MSDMNHHTIDIAEITDVEKSDKEADFEITDNFERFNQKNDVFRRSWWDANIRSEKSRIFYASYRKPLKTGVKQTASLKKIMPFVMQHGMSVIFLPK